MRIRAQARTAFNLPGECGGASDTGQPVVCAPTYYSGPATAQEPSVTATVTFLYYSETEPNPDQPNVGPFSCMKLLTMEGSTAELSAANCACPCPPPGAGLTFNPSSPIIIGTTTAISPPSGFSYVPGTSTYTSSNPNVVTLSNATTAYGVAAGSSFINSADMVYSPTSSYVATGCSVSSTILEVTCTGSPNYQCSVGAPECQSNNVWGCSEGGTKCLLPMPTGCEQGGYEWFCTQSGWQCQEVGQNGTPIVIDTKGQGFHLTSVAGGVQFPFFPGKPPVQISWTDANYSNGWLALDRNGNGKIDSGAELFGNLTPQPPSANPNGYAALAVFDDPANGGNGNGMIDSGDQIFDKLLVWIDSNHDGISQPSELHSLRDVGVSVISLHYSLSQYVDQFGNRFRYRAKILDEAGMAHDRCYDVFLNYVAGK